MVDFSYSKPSLNVFRRFIEYTAGRLFAEIPAVEVNSLNATDSTAQKCRLFGAVLDATKNSPKNVETIVRSGLAGLKTGYGSLIPEIINGVLRYTRLRFDECYWDPRDARDGKPQSFHILRRWSRSSLIAHVRSMSLVEEKNRQSLIEKIVDLPEATNEGPVPDSSSYQWPDPYDKYYEGSSVYPQDDQLWVSQSWRLPGGPSSPVYDGKWNEKNKKILRADAGRYVITVHGGTDADGRSHSGIVILDTGWERQSYPVCHWTPCPHEKGIDGLGLGDTLLGFQNHVDLIVDRDAETIEDLGVTKVLIRHGMADQKTNIASRHCTFVEAPEGAFSAALPGYEILPHNPLSNDNFSYLQRMLDFMETAIGVNQAGAKGQTSLGANASGIALVEEDVKQDVALQSMDWQWQQYNLRIAEETIYAMADATSEDSSFTVPYSDDTGTSREEKFKEVTSGLDKFTVQLEPVGILGKTKAGRIQRIIELARYGAVPAELAARFVATSPDVRRLQREAMAPADLVEWQLAGLSVEGKDAEYYAQYFPGENTPHALAIEMAIRRLQIAERLGVSDEVRERYDTYLMAARDEMSRSEERISANASGAPGITGGSEQEGILPGVVPELPPLAI